MSTMNQYELQANKKGYHFVLGVDEVGRGCLAGPLVCAALIFPVGYINNKIKDSKQLTAQQRLKLYDQILQDCLAYKIELMTPEEVDYYNPKQATRICMQKCIEHIQLTPDFVLSDFEQLDISIPNFALIKGDQKSVSIAGASILAKVYRDNLMCELDKQYPNYGFKNHKGYLTKEHLNAIQNNGPIKGIHRFSYRPLKK